tara:strand:- start:526 stop:822 length:297 start_codon:yes stop_codon:yes gene_type:complete
MSNRIHFTASSGNSSADFPAYAVHSNLTDGRSADEVVADAIARKNGCVVASGPVPDGKDVDGSGIVTALHYRTTIGTGSKRDGFTPYAEVRFIMEVAV